MALEGGARGAGADRSPPLPREDRARPEVAKGSSWISSWPKLLPLKKVSPPATFTEPVNFSSRTLPIRPILPIGEKPYQAKLRPSPPTQPQNFLHSSEDPLWKKKKKNGTLDIQPENIPNQQERLYLKTPYTDPLTPFHPPPPQNSPPSHSLPSSPSASPSPKKNPPSYQKKHRAKLPPTANIFQRLRGNAVI